MSKYVKYPRTYHLPWSEGVTDDDKKLKENPFRNKSVVVTVKMDGENTTLYNDHVHARSIDSNRSHPSRSWMKRAHAEIARFIPEHVRVCGENLHTKHTIYYGNLPSYFMIHSIWNRNECYSWRLTETIADSILYFPTVPVMYKGKVSNWNKKTKEWNSFVEQEGHEGYVIRSLDSFLFEEFKNNVAKYCRKEFINKLESSNGHWFNQTVVKNKLVPS